MMSDGTEKKEETKPPWEEERGQMIKVIDLQGRYIDKLRQENQILNNIVEVQKKKIAQYSDPGSQIDDMFAEAKDDFMFDDIGGLDHILSKVRRVEHGLMYPKMYECMGIRPPTGILFYGPPGCGKTMIAKAMANELDIYFIELNITKFGSKYVNESAGNLASILHACVDKYSKEGRKVMVCLDEAEGILSPRGRDSTGELDRCKTVFLNFMDGHEDNDGLIFAAATNRYDLIDEAVKRPGRFNEALEVSRPDLKGVEDIFVKQMGYIERQAGRQVYSGIDAGRLARCLYPKNPSGADIRFVLEETSHRMIQNWCEAGQGDSGWVISTEDCVVRQHQIEAVIASYDPSSRRNLASRPIGFGKR